MTTHKESMVDRVAHALAETFKEKVERSSGLRFDDTGVSMPGATVWKEYARAAIEAMRPMTEDVYEALHIYADDAPKAWDEILSAALKEE